MHMCTGESQDQRASGIANSITALSPKFWIYTNFDCNLECSYCVAESSPSAPRRALSLEVVRRLVDQTVDLGFQKLFFTGGEPFLLAEIYDMLAYASRWLQTTVLTNAMLIHDKRLDKLSTIARDNLRIQVSLDGAQPEHHDAYRGQGSWAKTVEGIGQLQSRGFHVLLSTTKTPANTDHLHELHAFRRSLGIPDEDHVVRPLARRGFSQEGIEVSPNTLAPEVTVTQEGVYWHPLVSPSDTDMLVTRDIFPLADAIRAIAHSVQSRKEKPGAELKDFT